MKVWILFFRFHRMTFTQRGTMDYTISLTHRSSWRGTALPQIYYFYPYFRSLKYFPAVSPKRNHRSVIFLCKYRTEAHAVHLTWNCWVNCYTLRFSLNLQTLFRGTCVYTYIHSHIHPHTLSYTLHEMIQFYCFNTFNTLTRLVHETRMMIHTMCTHTALVRQCDTHTVSFLSIYCTSDFCQFSRPPCETASLACPVCSEWVTRYRDTPHTQGKGWKGTLSLNSERRTLSFTVKGASPERVCTLTCCSQNVHLQCTSVPADMSHWKRKEVASSCV